MSKSLVSKSIIAASSLVFSIGVISAYKIQVISWLYNLNFHLNWKPLNSLTLTPVINNLLLNQNSHRIWQYSQAETLINTISSFEATESNLNLSPESFNRKVNFASNSTNNLFAIFPTNTDNNKNVFNRLPNPFLTNKNAIVINNNLTAEKTIHLWRLIWLMAGN
jgi:hypothetical protein